MYPKAYIEYLVHFHGDRDYFECHELLEEYWKEAPALERDPVWVSLIQIAVSLYHHRRGNFRGAERLLANSIRFIRTNPGAMKDLGLQEDTLADLLNERLSDIQKGVPYKSIHLPISDLKLEHECKALSEAKNMEWQSLSDLKDQGMINRHKLRDRSDVIAERLNQLAEKQKTRRGLE
ncbi:DUF309 domain-containing protein [Metabacillus sp. KIGAM252]|uniref:DUF309 domain-containing protein n=1 Tax=Metabacillus flavus TaxID=2823519 RepID=A0ABS5LGH8_9BACI|nr:DUF309 domain-containing protein [Metabacillus flavus]MBS2969469.1 DUF309 domain-containing protein [Metabacillus flavus]